MTLLEQFDADAHARQLARELAGSSASPTRTRTTSTSGCRPKDLWRVLEQESGRRLVAQVGCVDHGAPARSSPLCTQALVARGVSLRPRARRRRRTSGGRSCASTTWCWSSTRRAGSTRAHRRHAARRGRAARCRRPDRLRGARAVRVGDDGVEVVTDEGVVAGSVVVLAAGALAARGCSRRVARRGRTVARRRCPRCGSPRSSRPTSSRAGSDDGLERPAVLRPPARLLRRLGEAGHRLLRTVRPWAMASRSASTAPVPRSTPTIGSRSSPRGCVGSRRTSPTGSRAWLGDGGHGRQLPLHLDARRGVPRRASRSRRRLLSLLGPRLQVRAGARADGRPSWRSGRGRRSGPDSCRPGSRRDAGRCEMGGARRQVDPAARRRPVLDAVAAQLPRSPAPRCGAGSPGSKAAPEHVEARGWQSRGRVDPSRPRATSAR